MRCWCRLWLLLLLGTSAAAGAAAAAAAAAAEPSPPPPPPKEPKRLFKGTEYVDFTGSAALGDEPVIASSHQKDLKHEFLKDVRPVYGADAFAEFKGAKRGSLFCDQLLPLNATASSSSPAPERLSFEWKGEQLTAVRQSFQTFPQFNNRMVWVGDLLSTAKSPQPGIMIVTYNAACDPDILHLSIVLADDAAGNQNVIKSLACSSDDIQQCVWTVQIATAKRDELEMSLDHGHRQKQRARLLQSSENATHVATMDAAIAAMPDPTAAAAAAAALTAPQYHRHLALDSGAIIKVLYFYTDGVHRIYSNAKIYSMVVAAVATANQALANSNLPFRFQCVGIIPILPTQYNIDDHQQTLSDLQAGRVPGVFAKRDLYKADLVQVLINDGRYCGYGSLMQQPASVSFAPYAYSTVYPECLSSFSHIHELAHNMGASHNSADTAAGSGFTNGRGYRYCTAPGSFRSIMSYSCASSTRVPYFSSPSLWYMGKPTGTGSEDNRSVLLQTYKTVANLRVG